MARIRIYDARCNAFPSAYIHADRIIYYSFFYFIIFIIIRESCLSRQYIRDILLAVQTILYTVCVAFAFSDDRSTRRIYYDMRVYKYKYNT